MAITISEISEISSDFCTLLIILASKVKLCAGSQMRTPRCFSIVRLTVAQSSTDLALARLSTRPPTATYFDLLLLRKLWAFGNSEAMRTKKQSNYWCNFSCLVCPDNCYVSWLVWGAMSLVMWIEMLGSPPILPPWLKSSCSGCLVVVFSLVGSKSPLFS